MRSHIEIKITATEPRKTAGLWVYLNVKCRSYWLPKNVWMGGRNLSNLLFEWSSYRRALVTVTYSGNLCPKTWILQLVGSLSDNFVRIIVIICMESWQFSANPSYDGSQGSRFFNYFRFGDIIFYSSSSQIETVSTIVRKKLCKL